MLIVSGERKFDKEETGKNFHTIQTEYGNFSKSFQLPKDVLAKKIEATYDKLFFDLRIKNINKESFNK